MNKEDVENAFKYIKKIKLNSICFDCSKPSPTWLNIKYGVIICTECAGKHRSLGFRLKNFLLDKFREQEIKRAILGGNFPSTTNDLQEKYKNLEYLIDQLDSLDYSTPLNELIKLEKPPTFQSKKIEMKKPVFGLKVDSFVKTKPENKEEPEIKEEMVSKKAVIVKGKSLVSRKQYDARDVNKDKLGFGVTKVRKEDE